MPFDWKPVALEQVCPCLFVAKHPAIQSVQMQAAPVCVVSPADGFRRVHASEVAVYLVIHPVIQLAQDFTSDGCAEVVSPAANDRIKLREDRLDRTPLRFFPLFF